MQRILLRFNVLFLVLVKILENVIIFTSPPLPPPFNPCKLLLQIKKKKNVCYNNFKRTETHLFCGHLPKLYTKV